MSRIRKAALTAGFAYAHFAFAIASGLLLVPLTLRELGPRSWGLWLASGELVGYAAMVDLGVLGVLPWMLAELDGRQDRAGMRRLVGHGVIVATLVAIGYAVVALALWTVLPSALRLAPGDRALLGPPLAVLVTLTAVSYPLRVFRAVLGGLQDVHFNGVLTILQTALTFALTAVLLMQGYGIHALALGPTVPAFLILFLACVRAFTLAPDLMTGWTRPSRAELGRLMSNGVGVWLGAVGWHVITASNAIVITFIGHPELVPIYSCTAKLATMSTQLAWVLPDSGLVGLAQLFGERPARERLRPVVLMMLRLQLLLAGGAACVLLALNPAFVSAWVGPALFGGLTLNALFALGVVLSSVIHGLITTASVLGHRLRVGVAVLVNGVVQTVLALTMGRVWGMDGIAAAGLIAGALTAVPSGVRLLSAVTGLNGAVLLRELIVPWTMRVALLVAAAVALGTRHQSLGLVPSAFLTAILALLYVWQMRPLYVGLPLGHRLGGWLNRLGLMPPVASNVSL